MRHFFTGAWPSG